MSSCHGAERRDPEFAAGERPPPGGGALEIDDGALYPALHRLVKRGWIGSEWGTSENNRRAKYYSLTVEGRRQLGREISSWTRFSRALEGLLSLERAPEESP